MLATVNDRLLSLDCGNFALKAYDGSGAPLQVRSLHRELAQGERRLKALGNSPVIEMDGVTYHVGRQAMKYPTSTATVEMDKATLAKLHLAACVSVSGPCKLVVSHHNPDRVRNLLTIALKEQHEFVRNGELLKVDV